MGQVWVRVRLEVRMERLTTIRNRFWNNEKGPVKDHNLVITFTIRADNSLVREVDSPYILSQAKI